MTSQTTRLAFSLACISLFLLGTLQPATAQIGPSLGEATIANHEACGGSQSTRTVAMSPPSYPVKGTLAWQEPLGSHVRSAACAAGTVEFRSTAATCPPPKGRTFTAVDGALCGPALTSTETLRCIHEPAPGNAIANTGLAIAWELERGADGRILYETAGRAQDVRGGIAVYHSLSDKARPIIFPTNLDGKGTSATDTHVIRCEIGLWTDPAYPYEAATNPTPFFLNHQSCAAWSATRDVPMSPPSRTVTGTMSWHEPFGTHPDSRVQCSSGQLEFRSNADLCPAPQPYFVVVAGAICTPLINVGDWLRCVHYPAATNGIPHTGLVFAWDTNNDGQIFYEPTGRAIDADPGVAVTPIHPNPPGSGSPAPVRGIIFPTNMDGASGASGDLHDIRCDISPYWGSPYPVVPPSATPPPSPKRPILAETFGDLSMPVVGVPTWPAGNFTNPPALPETGNATVPGPVPGPGNVTVPPEATCPAGAATADPGALSLDGAGACVTGCDQYDCGQAKDAPRPRPPQPPRDPAADWSFEVQYPVDGSDLPGLPNHDWDDDGIPDLWDEVNLPSEARFTTAPGDGLNLVTGLSPKGFVLLVEPGHAQAQFVYATGGPLEMPSGSATVDALLDQLHAVYGVETGNGLATILHLGMDLHVTPVAPTTPTVVPFAWTGGAIPADASWAFIRNDPTQVMELHLGNQSVPLAPSLRSRFSADSSQDLRWEFLNLQGKPSFCFDPTSFTQLTSCKGHASPGWKRVYSGQADYALQALESEMEDSSLPVSDYDAAGLASTPLNDLQAPALPPLPPPPPATAPSVTTPSTTSLPTTTLPPLPSTTVPPPAVPPLPATTAPPLTTAPVPSTTLPSVPTPPRPTVGPAPPPPVGPLPPIPNPRRLPEACNTVAWTEHAADGGEGSLFDPTSQVHLLGDKSEVFPVGVGVDYRLTDEAMLSPLASVVQTTLDPRLPLERQPFLAEQDRQFLFEGSRIVTPAEPRDMNVVHLRITNLDCDESGQAFVLDGAQFASLLDLAGGESFRLDIDPSHAEGFAYQVLDVTGDGREDIVAYIPHFSAAWITVYSTAPEASATWWSVKLSSPTTGWLSGAYGAVYRFNGPSMPLVRYNVPTIASSQRTLGLFLISDTEFYVVGEGDGPAGLRPFVAKYSSSTLANVGSAWSVTLLSSVGRRFLDIWVNPSQTSGRIGGSLGDWYKLSGGTWTTSTEMPTHNCDIFSIAFNDAGTGYVGLYKATGSGTPCQENSAVSSIMRWDGSAFTKASTSLWSVYDVEPTGQNAAGLSPDASSTPGTFQSGSPSWSQMWGATPAHYYSVDRTPSTGEAWFVGTNGFSGEGAIVRYNGAWSRVTSSTYLQPVTTVDMYSNSRGLAGGSSQVVVIEVNTPPSESSWMSGTSGATTQTAVYGHGSGSDAEDAPGDLTHAWYWGDGDVSTTAEAQHYYSRPGTYYAYHRVMDTRGDYTYGSTFIVVVQAEPLSWGTCRSNTMPTADQPKEDHYVLPYMSGDRLVAISLGCDTTDSNLALRARSNAPVGSIGTWPTSGAGGSLLQGKAPAGNLYFSVVHPMDTTGNRYGVMATLKQPPSAPVSPSIPTVVRGDQVAYVSGRIDHPEGYAVRMVVDWGDTTTTAMPATGYTSPGTTFYLDHDYATLGTYHVRMWGEDQYGIKGTEYARDILVRDPPVATVSPADSVTADSARLRGTIASFGGAGSATATYKVYEWGNAMARPNSYTLSWPGPVDYFTVTGLLGGTRYEYSLQVTTDGATIETDRMAFETLAGTPLTISPNVSPAAQTVSLGNTASVTLTQSGPHSSNIRYTVRWGDGLVSMNPVGYTASGTTVVAPHTYRFPGTYTAYVRLEDPSNRQSGWVPFTVTVTGSVIQDIWHEGLADNADLHVKLGTIVEPGTQMSYQVYDPVTATWSAVAPFAPVSSNEDWSASTPALRPEVKHPVRFLFQTPTPAYWTAPAPYYLVSRNLAPTVTLDPQPEKIDYLDKVRYSVTYSDPDGDPPLALDGTAGPTLTVAGKPYLMSPSSPETPDYAEGAAYHVVVRLPEGMSHVATATAKDEFGHSSTDVGTGTFVTMKYIAAHSFESSPIGSTPVGFEPRDVPGHEGLNYWRTVDTAAHGVPDDLASGFHGRVLSFSRAATGTYAEPSGKIPAGDLVMAPHDLRTLMSPSLSFSSFYETEDTGTTRDLKQVLIQYREPGTTDWSTGPVRTLSGEADGHLTWKRITIDLAPYAMKEIRAVFRFDAYDKHNNDYRGWFIDDVVIGHDEDRDGLPDRLEEKRQDTRISSQVEPLAVSGGEEMTSYVRRLDRPFASTHMLQSIVRHANTKDLVVQVGVAPAIDMEGSVGYVDGKEFSYTLYDRGSFSNLCNYGNGLAEPSKLRPIVIEKSDGLDISIDLAHCTPLLDKVPLGALAEARSWHIRVRDIASSPQDAIVESLRIISKGQTDPLRSDTDWDGLPDQDEILQGRDPLGHDADRDGVPEEVDSDDEVANWMPAIAAGSDDFSSYLAIDFGDLHSVITSVTATARIADGREHPLTLARYEGAEYVASFAGLTSPPEHVRFDWKDDEGSTGSIGFDIVQEGADSGMTAVGIELRDEATSLAQMATLILAKPGTKPLIRFTVDAAGKAAVGELVVETELGVLRLTGSAVGRSTVAAAAEATATEVGLAEASARVAGRVLGGAVAILGYLIFEAEPVGDETHYVERDDFELVAVGMYWDSALYDTGLPAEDFDAAFQSAQWRVQLPERHVSRWLYYDEISKFIVAIDTLEGSSGTQYLRDAWKLDLPPLAGYAPGHVPTVGQLVAWELQQAEGLFGKAQAVPQTLVTKLAPDDLDYGCPVEGLSITSLDDGKLIPESFVPMPCAGLNGLRAAVNWRDSVYDQAAPQPIQELVKSATDPSSFVLSTGFDYVYVPMAHRNRLAAEATWYWDNDPLATPTACPPPGSALPPVRRCLPHERTGTHLVPRDTVVAYTPDRRMPIFEPARVYDLEWKDGATTKFQDTLQGTVDLSSSWLESADFILWVEEEVKALHREAVPTPRASVDVAALVHPPGAGALGIVSLNSP